MRMSKGRNFPDESKLLVERFVFYRKIERQNTHERTITIGVFVCFVVKKPQGVVVVTFQDFVQNANRAVSGHTNIKNRAVWRPDFGIPPGYKFPGDIHQIITTAKAVSQAKSQGTIV